MNFTLTPEQEKRIGAHVAAGDFASIEDAVRQFIDDGLVALSVEDDDLAWAKPFVDEARAGIARGEFITLEEHRARNRQRLAALKT